MNSISKSAVDGLADALRREILLGSLAAGAPLKQGEVAERFGVSVVPVREAFARLSADGLVDMQANRGVWVKPRSEADFVDISEMRQVLEPLALRLSIPHLTEADLQRAESLLEETESQVDKLLSATAHWSFHRTLYARCGRPRLMSTIDSLFLGINRYSLPIWSEHALTAEWAHSHEAIVEAIRAGDSEAACQMVAEQISQSQVRMVAALRGSQIFNG